MGSTPIRPLPECGISKFLIRILLVCLLPASAAVPSAEEQTLSLRVAGEQRLYLLYDFSGNSPAPLVIVLHGGTAPRDQADVPSPDFNASEEI